MNKICALCREATGHIRAFDASLRGHGRYFGVEFFDKRNPTPKLCEDCDERIHTVYVIEYDIEGWSQRMGRIHR